MSGDWLGLVRRTRWLPRVADAFEKGTGDDHVAGGTGVDTVPGEIHGVVVFEDGVEGGLDIDEGGVVPSGEVADDSAVAVHLHAHGVGLVGLDNEGGHEDEAFELRAGLSDEFLKSGGVFLGKDVDLGLERQIELTPDVVDTDHDGEPIGLEVEDVLFPARFEVSNRVARESLVNNADALAGMGGGEECLDLGDVAFAQRAEKSLADGFGAVGISDGVADHDKLAAFLDLHGMGIRGRSPVLQARRLRRVEVGTMMWDLLIYTQGRGGCPVSVRSIGAAM